MLLNRYPILRLSVLSTAMASVIGLAAHAAPAITETNIPHVTTILTPAPNFDPLAASDVELEVNGFPPRPDAKSSPAAYKSWSRAVTSQALRILPVLQGTNISHGPNVPHGNLRENALSNNWSGYAILNNVTKYSSKSFYFLVADYVVPVAQQAFGACTGNYDYSSSWIGIDGYNSNDVLQAGTEADAYCSGSTTASYYAAWYEWYPYNETRVSNFPVSAGNDIFVEVWSTSATSGHAFMVNYSTNQSFNLSFSAPAGTVLHGNSAEWVVERPGVNGSLATLTNYIQDFFSDSNAYDFSYRVSQPGAPRSGLTSLPINMVGSSSSDVISTPSLLGASGIWFVNSGSAR